MEAQKKKGVLIAIDGLDGSGKETQTRLLEQALKEKGIPCRSISFPTYDDSMSAAVKLYLSGAFGEDPQAVNGYAASVFYGVDRICSYLLDWKKDYENGAVILANRYTTANAVHQLSKLPSEEYDGFLNWLFDLEYGKMGLPEPDLVRYLCVPPARLRVGLPTSTRRTPAIWTTATAPRCIPRRSWDGRKSIVLWRTLCERGRISTKKF